MDHLDEQQPLPPPAPFMWACDECGTLLRALADTITADAGCFYEQLALSRHIVDDHPDDVPAPHTRNCEQCPHYAFRSQGISPADHWAEHLARDLFLPFSVARLL